MTRYFVRRLLYMIPTLIGVSLITFLLFFGIWSPETVARRNLTAKNPTHEQIQEWIVAHHYDKPKLEQFEDHMKSLLLLQFGQSDKTKTDIWERIKSGALPSFELALLGFACTIGMGLVLAMLAAYVRGTYIDILNTAVMVVIMSVPIVVYVIGLQYFFGKELRFGPIAGYQEGIGGLRFMVLPVMILVVSGIPNFTRLYRTFLLEEMNTDYVRTARAKGVRERTVLFKHVLKNAMIPVVTTSVSAIPLLILGNIVIETSFTIPGVGDYLVEAINGQDFAVVRAMVYLGTLLYIVGLMLTDVLYAVLDPRVRLQ